MAANLARALRAHIAEKYTDPDGRPWSGRRLELPLGIKQSQISEILRGDDEKERPSNAGTSALIALSRAMGKSIDELLGIKQPDPKVEAARRIIAKIEEVLDALRKTQAIGAASPIAVACGELAELVKEAGVIEQPTPQLDYFARVRELAPKSPLGKKRRTKAETSRKDDAPVSERAPRSRRKTA